jgi:hypothetical protein
MNDDQFNESLLILCSEVEKRRLAFQETPPPVVYHYTSAKGLSGVVNSARVWATTTAELNDTSELLHATEILQFTLRRHAREAALPEYKVLFPPQVLNFDYQRPDLATTFVSSLSGAEDDLSQWCMYADNFQGVALGFDSSALMALDAAADISQQIGFFAMSYTQGEQEEAFEWLVTRWEREASAAVARDLRHASNPNLYLSHWFGNLAVAAMSMLARMKSHHFHSENEWRLAHLHTRGREDCLVHSGNGAKTHVELDLTQLTGRLPLVSVWLAPGVANDMSEAALRNLLNTSGYHDVRTRRSEIPLRGTPAVLAV